MFRPILILTLPALLMGQSPLPQGPGFKTGPKASERKGPLKLRLHQFRAERLQQLLGVSSEKANGIADRWDQYDEDSQDHRQSTRKLHRQVNDILLSSLPEDEKSAKIQPLMDQLATLRQQQEELRRKFENDIRATLTPAQQGRFVLAVEEIQKAMLQAIKQHRKNGEPEPAP